MVQPIADFGFWVLDQRKAWSLQLAAGSLQPGDDAEPSAASSLTLTSILLPEGRDELGRADARPSSLRWKEALLDLDDAGRGQAGGTKDVDAGAECADIVGALGQVGHAAAVG